jgi:hypothetical protein
MLDSLDFQALSSDGRLTLLVLRLGPAADLGCIFRYYREPIQAQTGLSARRVEAALRELEANPSPDAPWIFRDRRILWIRNGLKYDPGLNLDNENNMAGVARHIQGLPESKVVDAFLAYYPQVATILDDPPPGPRGGPPPGPSVARPPAPGEARSSSSSSNPIQEKEQEQRRLSDATLTPSSLSSSKPAPDERPVSRFTPFPDTHEEWERQQQAKAGRR